MAIRQERRNADCALSIKGWDQDHVGIHIGLVAEILGDNVSRRRGPLENIKIKLRLAGFGPADFDPDVSARGGGGAETGNSERKFITHEDCIAGWNASGLRRRIRHQVWPA